MVTDQDCELLEALTRLTATTSAFGMDLVARNLAREAHIELALLLLDVADQVLRRMVEGKDTGSEKATQDNSRTGMEADEHG